MNGRNIDDIISALSHEHPNVRFDAVRELGMLGDVRAVDPLLKRTEDSDMTVRWQAVIALREINRRHNIPERLFDRLLAILKAGDEEPIQRVALFALADIKDPRAVPVLLDVFPHVSDALALEIFHGLLIIGGPESAGKLAPMLPGKNPLVQKVITERLRESGRDLDALS